MSYFAQNFDEQIARLVLAGKIGLLPADTIYGLSCRALDEAAVRRIYKVKRRDSGKSLIILISDIDQAASLGVEPQSLQAAMRYWPGPLTLKVVAPNSPEWLRPDGTLALRLPANEPLRELIAKTGPLVSTSANFQGEEPIASAVEARNRFGARLDFYVDIGPRPGSPSTIVRPKNGKLEIVRQGALKLDQKDIYDA